MGSRAADPRTSAVSMAVLRASRDRPAVGLSRRQLLRRAMGAGVGLWLVEMAAGTTGWLWSGVTAAAASIPVGTYPAMVARQGALPFADGFPAYVADARAFVMLVDPARGGWVPGEDLTGDGIATNVRALSQRCPHLGCRPNPCLEDFWFHCPCHQSRYDRLGIKVEGERYGPAARGMDRYATSVDARGVLTIDTRRVILGPLPVALGEPGVIPPLVANGCV
jgi:cytochrome b6-f complex iron-sulfur subunit